MSDPHDPFAAQPYIPPANRGSDTDVEESPPQPRTDEPGLDDREPTVMLPVDAQDDDHAPCHLLVAPISPYRRAAKTQGGLQRIGSIFFHKNIAQPPIFTDTENDCATVGIGKGGQGFSDPLWVCQRHKG